MSYIRFDEEGKGGYKIRVAGAGKGHIINKRGKYVAVITRCLSLDELEGLCVFIASLNRT
jgi:hypothetical protein